MSNGHALVTGASGGIGLEIARLLAARGDRLILVARSRDKLTALVDELGKAGSPEVIALPADLGSVAGVRALLDELSRRGLEVDTLVNNAGFGSAGAFASQDAGEQLGMVELNVTALTLLTRELLPAMLERKRGAILNVASTAAFQPGPFLAVYYATKAYVLSLSEALRSELAGSGVQVVTLCPGPTDTGFANRARLNNARQFRSGAVMHAAPVARAAVEQLDRGGLVVPGILNKLLIQLQRVAPRALVTAIARRMNANRSP